MRSNMFANLESKFQFASTEQLVATAKSSMREMFDAMDAFSMDAKINVALIGIKLGAAGDGVLNAQEKMLIQEVFGASIKVPMEQFCELLEDKPGDDVYNAVRNLTQLGNGVAMPFLHFVLCFAYIDGVFEDDVAEKLDGIFGMNLMVDFFSSDLEEVPCPKIGLTRQEAEIVDWFLSDDQLRSLTDIQKHFPDKSRAELKRLLDGLCQKGILYGGDNFVGCMYGLESTSIEYEVLPERAAKSESKSVKESPRKNQCNKQKQAGGKPEVEQIPKDKKAAEKDEADRIRKEKEAAEKVEAERIRKEKEAAEKAEAERIRKKKEAEENRRMQEEAKAFALQAERLRARCAVASDKIAISMYHAVAVRDDGTVVAKGRNNDGQCNVSSWKNVVAVACDPEGTVGLTASGHVLYAGDTSHKQNQCTSWSNIKAIAMGDNCVYGLKKDGTVVATTEGSGGSRFSTSPDVTTWRNIVAIRTEWPCKVMGIDQNGRVFTVNRNYYGKCEYMRTIWSSGMIDARFGSRSYDVGLRKNGTCCTSENVEELSEINKHKNILSVYFYQRPFALLADGRIVVEPDKTDPTDNDLVRFINKYRLNNVVGIALGHGILFLTNDGRIYGLHTENKYGIEDGEFTGKEFRLFNDFHKLMDKQEAEEERLRREKEEQEKKRAAEEALRAERRKKNLCQHCGGMFKKVLFGMKCTSCGERKDY